MLLHVRGVGAIVSDDWLTLLSAVLLWNPYCFLVRLGVLDELVGHMFLVLCWSRPARTFGVVFDTLYLMSLGPASLGIETQHTQLNNFRKTNCQGNFYIIKL